MTADSDSYPPELAVGVTGSRIATVSPAARAVHREVLRGFAATGHAPDPGQLSRTGVDVGRALAELHDHDVVRLDDLGRIRAAYPFSAVPTAHVVAIDDGPTVHAMCAIDALGIADMLDRPVAITSAEPTSGAAIDVRVHSGHATWRPAGAVVFVGSDTTAPGGDCCAPDGPCAAPAADRCCGVINFFASDASAQAWLAVHPGVSGVVLTGPQALRLGVDIFGHLLDD